MDLEQQVARAIVDELQRQADAPSGPKVDLPSGGRLAIRGEIDLEALSTAVVGAVAGGP
jgi:hypothetical protein